MTWSAVWLGLVGCSGTSFSSNPAGAGADGQGGTVAGSNTGGVGAGASGGSSSAGDSSNGGAPDVAGSGGSAGSGVTPACDCPAGRYCREGSTDCFDCAELNRLRFTPPERLATLSDNGQGSSYPRVGMTTTDLVYVFNGIGLRYTTDSSTSAGSSVKGTLTEDSGPLLMTESVAAVAMGIDFFFDRKVTTRQLYAGVWSEGAQSMLKLPPPFNAEQEDDYSIAVASHPGANSQPRAFWMSSRSGAQPRLFTAFLQPGTTAEEVSLRLAKDIPSDDPNLPSQPCATSDADLSPWVTRDGKTLLFSHTRVDANCQIVGAQKRDLYTTLLQPANGQPPADASNAIIPATPINDVNSGADDVEPSFSADMCDLYFSSNRDGKFAVYRAHRR